MVLPVSLDEVARELDGLMEQATAFINRQTGEITTLTDNEISLIEDEPQEEDLPGWQREMLPTVREIVSSENWVALADKFDIHEWEIMRKFADSVDDDDLSQDLQRAIHGNGAFRMFRATIEDAGIQDEWFAFKHQALREIAQAALEELGVPYQ